MKKENLSNLTDQELIEKANKMKSTSIINALLVGFMIGIVVWSVAKNTVGLLTLIPLIFIYKLVNNSKNDKVLKQLLKDRNLKLRP
jgi:hypothetical protein